MGGWVAFRVMVPGIEMVEVPVPPNVAKRVGQPAQTSVERNIDEEKTNAEAAAPLRPDRPAPQLWTPAEPALIRRALPALRHAQVVPPQRGESPLAPVPPATLPSPATPPLQPAQLRSTPSLRLLPFSAAQARDGDKRWSADGWLLWRKDSGSVAALPGAASYGASQAGAVLRYRLSQASALHPRAHLRVTSAIDRADREVAVGIGIQPVPEIPFEILAEGRLGTFADDAQARPAVLGVFGPPAQSLPLNLTAELYAQGGYVGGTDPTAFVDGQMRVTRAVSIGPVQLQAGAGIWGGAQEGVERIDAGPTISLTAPLGELVFARVSIDWRERVAGDAEPGSGPVVTLSAGF